MRDKDKYERGNELTYKSRIYEDMDNGKSTMLHNEEVIHYGYVHRLHFRNEKCVLGFGYKD